MQLRFSFCNADSSKQQQRQKRQLKGKSSRRCQPTWRGTRVAISLRLCMCLSVCVQLALHWQKVCIKLQHMAKWRLLRAQRGTPTCNDASKWSVQLSGSHLAHFASSLNFNQISCNILYRVFCSPLLCCIRFVYFQTRLRSLARFVCLLLFFAVVFVSFALLNKLKYIL